MRHLPARLFLLYWVLWTVLVAFVVILAADERQAITKDAKKLEKALGSNINWLFRASLPDSEAATFFLQETSGIAAEFLALKSLPRRLEARLRNASEEIRRGKFSEGDGQTFVSDVGQLFLEQRLATNKITANYRAVMPRLLFILGLYQLGVVLVYQGLQKPETGSIHLVAEGFFNAIDLTLIAAFCSFFYQDESSLTYFLFLAYVYHTMLFGATIAKYDNFFFSSAGLYITLSYGMSILVPFAVSWVALGSMRFLSLGLGTIPLSVVLGYVLRRYGALDWLANYLPAVPHEARTAHA